MKKKSVISIVFILITGSLLISSARIQQRNNSLQLNPKLKMQLDEISRIIRVTKRLDPGTQRKWNQCIVNIYQSGAGVDIQGIIQSILKDSYKEIDANLAYYADKVKYINQLKSDIRDHINELRKSRSQSKAVALRGMNKQSIRIKVKDFSPAIEFLKKLKRSPKTAGKDRAKLKRGRIFFISRTEDPVNQKVMEAKIKSLENQLKSLGEDGQKAQLDLQNAIQKSQQNLQKLSNISKKMGDLAFNASKNIK